MDPEADPYAKFLEPYEAANSVLEFVLETVLGRYQEEADLQEEVLQRIVTTCAEDSLTIVALAEVSREGPASPGSWQLDDEPPSCACDTWARGSLPVKQRIRAPLADTMPRQSQRRASVLGGLDTRKSVAQQGPGKSRYAPSVASHTSDRGKKAKEDHAPAANSAEEDYEARLRNELDYRRQQQEAYRQSLVKEQEEKLRLQLISKEMRGKEFGYDHKGEVVVLNKVDPEKLPPADLMLTFKVTDTVANPTGRNYRRSSILQPTFTIARPVKKAEKDRKSVAPGPDFVPLASAGEFVRSDQVPLQPGVTIKYASMVKAGPARDISVGKPLTKTEYFSTVGGGFVAEEAGVRPLSPSSTRGHSRSSLAMFGEIQQEGSEAREHQEPAGNAPLSRGGPSREIREVDPSDPASLVASILRPTSQDRQRLLADGVPVEAPVVLPPLSRHGRSRGQPGVGTLDTSHSSSSVHGATPVKRTPTFKEHREPSPRDRNLHGAFQRSSSIVQHA